MKNKKINEYIVCKLAHVMVYFNIIRICRVSICRYFIFVVFVFTYKKNVKYTHFLVNNI